MGKKIKRASIKTFKTLWMAYSKIAAVIFAMFCAITGLSRPTYGKSSISNATIRGQALNRNNSSILRNFKIYLCTEICPLYGINSKCMLMTEDSVVTDSNGKFQINNSDGRYSQIVFVHAESKDSVNSTNKSEFKFQQSRIADTSVTIYLTPLVKTGVLKNELRKNQPTLIAQLGSTINITLDKWDPAVSYSVSMTRLDGRALITSPLIISNGILSINTSAESKGLYILSVKSDKFQSNTRIQIK